MSQMEEVSIVLMQLAGQSPVLLAYVSGMVLALVFWRRCPVPAALAFVASAMLFVTAIGLTWLQFYLIHRGVEAGWSMQWWMSLIAIVGSMIRAGGIGLLIAAVFVGRSRMARSVMPSNREPLYHPDSETRFKPEQPG